MFYLREVENLRESNSVIGKWYHIIYRAMEKEESPEFNEFWLNNFSSSKCEDKSVRAILVYDDDSTGGCKLIHMGVKYYIMNENGKTFATI